MVRRIGANRMYVLKYCSCLSTVYNQLILLIIFLYVERTILLTKTKFFYRTLTFLSFDTSEWCIEKSGSRNYIFRYQICRLQQSHEKFTISLLLASKCLHAICFGMLRFILPNDGDVAKVHPSNEDDDDYQLAYFKTLFLNLFFNNTIA